VFENIAFFEGSHLPLFVLVIRVVLKLEVSSTGRTFLLIEQITEALEENPCPVPLFYNTTQKNWLSFCYGLVLGGETPETYT